MLTFIINKKIKLDYIDQLKPIPEPQKTVIKKPLLLKILERLAPKTTHSNATIQTTEEDNEDDLQYYDVYGNDEESEDDAWTEEENEDLWQF
ncbi:hypothetical protein KAS24_03115 [Candidatus Bathyarchaeota archaeon]|nr:hypothetical protein [Candidatus Bathyarchaeota archaeon]